MTTAAPTKAPPKAKQETWADWFTIPIPDAELVTRQDILARAKAEGFDVPEGSLVYWEKQGILPRAIRKWRDGKPAALYPRHAVNAVITVPIMQQQRASLAEIRETIRTIHRRPSTKDERAARSQAKLEAAAALRRPLLEYARMVEHVNRREIIDVAIHMRDAAGNVLVHGYGSPRGLDDPRE
jgi:hypothetical protein